MKEIEMGNLVDQGVYPLCFSGWWTVGRWYANVGRFIVLGWHDGEEARPDEIDEIGLRIVFPEVKKA
jgi:hypothetical protein